MLETLNLADNQLSGSIPALPPSVYYLDVSANQLSGTVPALPIPLQWLYLGDNQLSGIIPTSLANTSIPLSPPYDLKLCGGGSTLTSIDSAVNAFIAARIPGWTGSCPLSGSTVAPSMPLGKSSKLPSRHQPTTG